MTKSPQTGQNEERDIDGFQREGLRSDDRKFFPEFQERYRFGLADREASWPKDAHTSAWVWRRPGEDTLAVWLGKSSSSRFRFRFGLVGIFYAVETHILRGVSSATHSSIEFYTPFRCRQDRTRFGGKRHGLVIDLALARISGN